jgi:glycosyltransferase involved in cell wall biosynthesis
VIAYLHQAAAWGAVESYLGQILAELDEPAVVIHPAGPELAPLAQYAELRPYDADRSAPLLLAHLVRELRAVRPRLVHVVDVWPLAFLAARIARVPRVVVTHHTPELPRTDNFAGRALLKLGWLTRPEVIYTSESDRARDGRAPSHVIELGIELERFEVDRRAHEGAVVGNVARLAKQKGQRTLVEAAPLVLERHPETRFVIVGDGELRGELEQLAHGLPFEFRGQRDDIPAQLAEMDVFAFPSLFEGLCLAVIEAQAAGVPVVATPVGGIPENVRDGETGLLVPPRDPVALAGAINELLDDPRRARELAERARPRVFERYSLERMVARTLALYGSPSLLASAP